MYILGFTIYFKSDLRSHRVMKPNIRVREADLLVNTKLTTKEC